MKKLNKLNKFILVLISVITIFLLVPVILKAASGINLDNIKQNGYEAIGKSLSFNASEMSSRDDMYCLDIGAHWDWINGAKATFTVKNYVEIDGNTATSYDKNGKEIGTTTNQLNGKIAFILGAHSQGYRARLAWRSRELYTKTAINLV